MSTQTMEKPKTAKAAPKKAEAKTETRAQLLAKVEKMGLKNRRTMNMDELVEVTKTSTSKSRIDEILKKAVARHEAGLGGGKRKKKK